MVRLKDEQAIDEIIENSISIPYGAIKSVKKLIKDYEIFKFQFLMVRLKDKNKNILLKLLLDFNSLWCD